MEHKARKGTEDDTPLRPGDRYRFVGDPKAGTFHQGNGEVRHLGAAFVFCMPDDHDSEQTVPLYPHEIDKER